MAASTRPASPTSWEFASMVAAQRWGRGVSVDCESSRRGGLEAVEYWRPDQQQQQKQANYYRDRASEEAVHPVRGGQVRHEVRRRAAVVQAVRPRSCANVDHFRRVFDCYDGRYGIRRFPEFKAALRELGKLVCTLKDLMRYRCMVPWLRTPDVCNCSASSCHGRLGDKKKKKKARDTHLSLLQILEAWPPSV
ncbi:hypothetical protein E2562_010935 [Oryza meyeriana var. granulata]|uniref:Uncharacterized protein n=1 Tax=Oryza meyeriana var. granulata TaxID=110450 RepID=A0A6G1BVJ2_9ORYZ|nr:hypothetical protein E2562_010935 [Oryza meyeriana var. granulata]